ncbi:glycosyltransferase family 2 protein [Chthonobacter albigriseus]|uniref:glycosyltransferase family 2 protein n=1 Tax=Chthonobacter albigriseus TaxID=1683161 RepID=UPI0015EFC82A|nr:glycosyltransferase [Chthonobacter albigriseus]
MPFASDQPLVAIVTPCYNGAEFLQEVIDSVQEQTYPNLVHVILDNASKDATPEIIKANLGRRVPIVTARNPEVLSLQANWSTAVKLAPAEAEWMRLLCHDDRLRPDAIEKMVAAAGNRANVGIVTSQVESSLGGIPNRGLPEDRTIFSGAEIGASMMTLGWLVVRSDHVMVRRRFIDERDPFYDLSVLSCDVDVVFRIISGHALAYVHEPVAWVREHAASQTNTTAKNDERGVLEWHVFFERYGRNFFTAEKFEEARETYRRKYLLRLYAWRYLQGRRELFDKHRATLAELGWKPGWVDVLKAAFWFGPHKVRQYFNRKAHRAMLERSRQRRQSGLRLQADA